MPNVEHVALTNFHRQLRNAPCTKRAASAKIECPLPERVAAIAGSCFAARNSD
jgi:hypothetical protein